MSDESGYWPSWSDIRTGFNKAWNWAREKTEEILSNISPIYNLVEAYTGKTIITGQSLTDNERYSKGDKFEDMLVNAAVMGSVKSVTTRSVSIPKGVERQAKKLTPEAQKGFNKAIEALKSGDTRGLNEHSLSGNRGGQWAVDIKGTGRGRGAGRIIFEKSKDGNINIIEIFTDHKY